LAHKKITHFILPFFKFLAKRYIHRCPEHHSCHGMCRSMRQICVFGATIKETRCIIRNAQLHHRPKKSLTLLLIQPVQSISHCFPTNFEVIYVIKLPFMSSNSSFANDLVTSIIIKYHNNLKSSGNSKSSCWNNNILKPQRSVYIPPHLTPQKLRISPPKYIYVLRVILQKDRGVYRVLVGRPEGKRPSRRPRRRWEDDIKMNL
jgi:hypothetical protein